MERIIVPPVFSTGRPNFKIGSSRNFIFPKKFAIITSTTPTGPSALVSRCHAVGRRGGSGGVRKGGGLDAGGNGSLMRKNRNQPTCQGHSPEYFSSGNSAKSTLPVSTKGSTSIAFGNIERAAFQLFPLR